MASSRRSGVAAEESFIRGGSDFALGFKLGESGAVFLLLKLFDFELGVLQTGFAEFKQFVALLKLGEEFRERHFAGLHRFDDGFEFGEGGFEGEFGVFGFHAAKMRG